MTLPQFQIEFDPQPNPKAVVTAPHVRFTVLTDRLIRMEFSPGGQFEDHPSQSFWYRNLPVPEFDAPANENFVEIETPQLHLSYRVTPRGFTSTTLQVIVKATGHTWHYGDNAYHSGNLGGTYRTLDEAAGFVRPDPGLMATTGGAAYDDSKISNFQRCLLAGTARPPRKPGYLFFWLWLRFCWLPAGSSSCGWAHTDGAALYFRKLVESLLEIFGCGVTGFDAGVQGT